VSLIRAFENKTDDLIKVFLIVAACCLGTSAQAQLVPALRDTFPVPPQKPTLLFYIQRTSNINTIVYELNSAVNPKSSTIVPESLINIYWLRYAEDSKKEALSYVQRNFAYGLNIKPAKAGVFEFNFVSYKKLKFNLEYSPSEHRYVVFAQAGGTKVRLIRLFIKIDGGSFWFPKVDFVEVKGIDPQRGKEVNYRFKP
jgi:Domain of unknown function (DUF4833)